MEYKVSAELLSSMAMTKAFTTHNTGDINSLDFSSHGDLLVTSSDDESIHLYTCTTGELKSKVFSKKYGVDLIRFVNQSKTHVITASKNGWDETIRYLSLVDNQYIRYFKGHRDRVVSFAVSSTDSVFFSSSCDSTIRMWDLRTPTAQGVIRERPSTTSSFLRASLALDPASMVLAVATKEGIVKLFDRRLIDAGPFSVFSIDAARNLEWRSVTFSPDAKYLILLTNINLILLIDAFTGAQVQQYTSFYNSGKVLEASMSPDGEFVISGSEDGTVHLWHALSGKEVAVWSGHKGPVGVARWNPRVLMVASGSSCTSFWTLPQQP